jgi:hypothetical protein
MFVLVKLFQESYIRVGSSLTWKYFTILKELTTDKHTGLFFLIIKDEGRSSQHKHHLDSRLFHSQRIFNRMVVNDFDHLKKRVYIIFKL